MRQLILPETSRRLSQHPLGVQLTLPLPSLPLALFSRGTRTGVIEELVYLLAHKKLLPLPKLEKARLLTRRASIILASSFKDPMLILKRALFALFLTGPLNRAFVRW